MSGGDPYLGYTMVQPAVKGIQSQKVIANAKHWVHNNQEENRDKVSANIDERTRFELYYEPFQGAIDAGVGSFMCSYNRVDDVYSCENSITLGDLKGASMGFNGWVMSDWGATHSLSIVQGLDQEMPSDDYFGADLTAAVNDGTIPVSAVDSATLRILTPMFQIGLFDDTNPNSLSNNVTSSEHSNLSRQLSAASHVLLKNDNNILPLSTERPLKIAMFGLAAREPVCLFRHLPFACIPYIY